MAWEQGAWNICQVLFLELAANFMGFFFFGLGIFLKPNNHYVFILSVLIHWWNFTFYRFVHFFFILYLPTWKYIITGVSGHHGGQKHVSDLLGLELQAIMRGHMDSGNQVCVLCKSSKYSLPINHLYSCKNPFLNDLLLKRGVFRKIQYRKLLARKPRVKEFSNATPSGIIWKCRKTLQVTEDK